MSEILFDLLKPARNEWLAFLDGRIISANLLLQLLELKYALQRSVRIQKDIIHLERETDLTQLISNAQALPSSIAYEFIIVIFHYGNAFVTTLAVRRQRGPLILFTIPGDEEMRETDIWVRYIVNNHYTSDIDNGYFVFDFLNNLFHTELANNEENRLLYEEIQDNVDTKEIAREIVNELTHFTRIKMNLLRIYKKINSLLIESREKNRLAIEYYKQKFFQWTECILHQQRKTITSCVYPLVDYERKVSEQICYFSAPLILFTEDPMESDIETNSDTWFKELIGLAQFLIRVVATSDSVREKEVGIEALGKDEVSLFREADIKKHVQRLRYLIITHIDKLNIPQQITTKMATELGFNQSDYTNLLSDKIVPYNIIARYLRDSLQPQTQLLDRTQTKGAIREDSRLLFWLLEEESEEKEHTLYDILMILHLPTQIDAWQRAVYAPANHSKDTLYAMNLTLKILKETGLFSCRTQFYSHDKVKYEQYSITSWYAILIMKAILARLANQSESLAFDWVGDIRNIIDAIMPAMIGNEMELLYHTVRGYILQVTMPEKCTQQIIEIIDTDEEEEEEEVPYDAKLAFSSYLSDIAILNTAEQFINDNVIADMIHLLPSKPECHIFDALYWGDMIKKKTFNNPPRNSAFHNPVIRKLVMPLNQNNIHWSLAVINKENQIVTYYSSIENDAYFEQTFKKIMTVYLASLTPTVTYKIIAVEGPLQSSDCVDCALFMLNAISQLCSTTVVEYTRDSVTRSILNRMIVKLVNEKQHDWRRIARDFHNQFLSGPSSLRYNSDAEKRRLTAEYRKIYIKLLLHVIRESHVFDRTSIDALFEKLVKVKSTETYDNILALFNKLLLPIEIEAATTVKRQREEEEEEEEEKKAVKTRKCLVYDSGTQKLIDQLITSLVTLKKLEKQTKESFIRHYHDYILHGLLGSLVTNIKVRESFLKELVNALFLEQGQEEERLLDVIEMYVACEETEKIVIKCVYCNTLTSYVDLSNGRAYCRADHRK